MVPAKASPTTSENNDPAPKPKFAEVKTPGSCLDRYSLARAWTSSDRCGNVATEAQVIAVQDTTPPSPRGGLLARPAKGYHHKMV